MDNENKNINEQEQDENPPKTAEELLKRLKQKIKMNLDSYPEEEQQQPEEDLEDNSDSFPIRGRIPKVAKARIKEEEQQETEKVPTPEEIEKMKQEEKESIRQMIEDINAEADIDENFEVPEKSKKEPSKVGMFNDINNFDISDRELEKFLHFANIPDLEKPEDFSEEVIEKRIMSEKQVDTSVEQEETVAEEENVETADEIKENEQVETEFEAENNEAAETGVIAEKTDLPDENISTVTNNIELSIGGEAEKTNVFVPSPKAKSAEEAFAAEFDDSQKDAEQLTFSMTGEMNKTSDDIQKSIKAAEDYIYQREHVDTPSDVIVPIEHETLTNPVGDVREETGDYDQTDVWIASAFGEEGEVEEQYGAETAKEVDTEIDMVAQTMEEEKKPELNISKLDEEFTSNTQTKDIFKKYKILRKHGLLKIGYCAVMLIITFLYENLNLFGGHLTGALNPAVYPVINVLISLQLLVFAALPAWNQLYMGVKALLIKKPIPESFASVAVILSAVMHIVFCFTVFTGDKFTLYIFPITLMITLLEIYDFLNLEREILSFRIVSSKRIKYSINRVSGDDARLETQAFAEYVGGDNVNMFKIGKTGFVNGFRERMNSYSQNNGLLTLFIPISLAVGLVFAVVGSVVFNIKSGLSAGLTVYMLSIPMSLFISFCYPFYRASKKAFDEDSAIIGDASVEEYSHANTISFDDKDVFPSYGVKVKSVKVYGDSRIDKILYTAASLFKVIGGPLSDVFDMATVELGHSDDVELIEVSDNGIEATIDGNHIYAGRISYLIQKGISPIVDPDDEQTENSGEASIMYLVNNEEVSAKMYIQYMIDPDFEYTLRKLYKAGLCIGIKTFDPNIDDTMLGRYIKLSRYPVRILRCRKLEDMSTTAEEVESGIISKHSPRSLLQAFILCTRVGYTERTSIIVKVLSVSLAILLMGLLMLFGKITTINSLYVVLYQLFWIVPVYLISKVSI